MTNQNNAAQAADTNPLSDEYVNAVIQQHGYDSPECVIARLHQWIGLHGRENGVTLLMYEAHKALSKLRAPVADERELPPLPAAWGSAINDAGDSHIDLYSAEQMQEYARAALASAPVAPQACPTDVCQAGQQDGVLCANDECDRANGVRPASAPVAEPIQWPTMPPSKGQSPVLFEDGYAEGWAKCMDECRRAVSLASAPVAGEAQPVAWRYRRASQKESMRLAGREPSEAEWHFAPHATRTTEMREGLRYNFAPSSDHVDWEPLYAAPQASEAVRDALWTLTEHNALHFGEQHNTVIQGRAALSAQPAHKPATARAAPAPMPRQQCVCRLPETGNAHTDGGAVYE